MLTTLMLRLSFWLCRAPLVLASFIMAVLMWASPLSPSVSANGNLLQNPDFETGNLSPWVKWGYPASLVTVVNCCAQQGAWSALIMPQGQYVEMQQSVSVVAGDGYNLRAWVQTSGIQARVEWYSNITGSQLCGTSSSTSYVLISCEFHVPVNTTVFNVHVSAPAVSSGWVITDNWSLESKLENAYRYQITPHDAAYSALVAGNPTLRDDVNGKWSYMRVFSQRYLGGGTYYAEIGWIKGAQPDSNYVPRVYWAAQPVGAAYQYSWGPYPTQGIGHNYLVERTANATWSFYFNSMEIPIHTEWDIGWDTADNFGSGGETPDARQGMGDPNNTASNNNNVQYMTPGGIWYAACSTTNNITWPIYFIANGPYCFSWRVYGNN